MRKSVVSVSALLVLAVTSCGGPSGEELALETCREEILDQLLSPTSAEFTDFEAANMTAAIREMASDPPSEEPEDVLYSVTGDVDSDNEAGVSIRNGILCMITIKDGEVVESETLASLI